MSSLLVVGTVAFDTIETPFGKAERVVGGAATYISWAASFFTHDIHLVSVVGDDFPQAEIDTLAARGVNMDGLQILKGQKSFFWHGKYHLDMNTRDTLATELNVLANFSPVVPDAAKKAKFLMLGNLTPQIQLQVIQSMTDRPELIALDTMNYWIDQELDALKEVLGHVDVLLINDAEARQLSGEYSLRKAARVIQDMGPKYLVIKKGENGALLMHGDDIFFCPALPLEDVFDPTGAGDSFAGGFMGYLARTGDASFTNMKRAIIYGSTLASFSVEKFGIDHFKEIIRRDIDDRVEEFVELMEVHMPLEKL